MSLLVFGRTGQVATELRARAPEATYLGRDAADLGDPKACSTTIQEAIREAIRAARPSAVINAAAYTAVDRAEAEEDLATRVNGAAPGAMAAACAELGVPFVHISTDYVFAGDGETPWRPGDPTGPLGAYGRSKLAGEEAVRAACHGAGGGHGAGGVHAILRTSWVFSSHGANFLKTMLRLSETRDRLTIVADQVGGPTPAGGIAAACLTIAQTLISEPDKAGTYHYAGAPDASWAEFARAIFAAAGRDATVEDIPTSGYPTPAARPLNSRLDCSATEAAFGIARPDWRQAVAQIVKELT